MHSRPVGGREEGKSNMNQLRKLFTIAIALTITGIGAYALSLAWSGLTSFEATCLTMIGAIAWLFMMAGILGRK